EARNPSCLRRGSRSASTSTSKRCSGRATDSRCSSPSTSGPTTTSPRTRTRSSRRSAQGRCPATEPGRRSKSMPSSAGSTLASLVEGTQIGRRRSCSGGDDDTLTTAPAAKPDALAGGFSGRPNIAATMDEIGTTRLEAFSDGVFAIAATLLVLEIGVHAASGAQLGRELTRIWPSYLAYVTSFITIGIIWINHHHNMRAIERIDRTFMFLNLLLLLDVAFIPFPTKLVAEYLRRTCEGPAVIAYAATLLLMAVLYTLWWSYARTDRRLIAPTVSEFELRAID